ncbi:MAG TPA: PASTA domain-containing protein [Acidobacteriaceae bacterium]|nr:PASTA domain-containing protein [Acidobacteriaceae bacterium]
MIRYFRLLLGVMLLGFVAMVAAIVTMQFAIHGSEVKAPSLVWMTINDAVHETAAKGLNLGIDNKYYSADVPAGRILEQSPAPGTVVRREWRMRVTESLGPQRVTIPDVVGKQESEAAMEIQKMGLDLEETAQVPYAGEPPGTVIAQTPDKGSEAAARPSISLLVATAPAAEVGKVYVMPKLVGSPYYAATGLISHAGFKIGPMEDDPNAPTETDPDKAPPPGIIMTQTPPPGWRVDGNTYIALTISQ